MVESTAKLREEIMALSGVDIMLDSTTFKSTYQIMEELAAKWQDLTDIQQASVTELIAGKRQGNIVSSLMNNFDIAQNALETSLNSSGSAMKEHEKWSQSLEARLLKLKAAWQGFAQTFMNSSFLKGAIDTLIAIVDVLDKLIDNFGLLGTIGLGAAGFGIFKAIKGDAIETVESISDVIKAIENIASTITDVTKTASNVTETVSDTVDTVTDVIDAASDAGETISNTTEIISDVTGTMEGMAETSSAVTKAVSGISDSASDTAKVIGNVSEAAGDGIEAMTNLGGAVKKTTGGFKAFMKTPIGVASAIGVLVAALGLAYNAYKNVKEEAAEARQETIRSSDEFLDAATSFEQAYIKYSGRTDLTAQEESELEAAINGTVDALGDKSSALKDVVNSSNDYVTSLESIKNAELEAAKKAATDKKRDAELELEEAAMGWERWDGSEVDISLEDYDKVYDIAEGLNSKFFYSQKQAINDLGSAGVSAGFTLSKDATTKDIIEYYNTLISYRDKLENELSDEELIDSSDYEEVNAAIEKMTDSINTYIEGVYEAAKAQYQIDNGIPKTLEEYIKMRESILNNKELDGLSVESLKSIAADLDVDYGQVFDLSTVEFQARKLVGILDEYGDTEAGKMEAFLNMRTAVNNNECSVGEYMSQFDEINKMTEDWGDAAKEELNTSFGLDTDSIKQQYEEMETYLLRQAKKGSEEVTKMSRQEARAYYQEVGSAEEQIREFLNGLTASELSAFVSIKTEIDWQNTSKDEILAQIQKEAEFLEAMNYTIAIDVETESLDTLNSALSESVSGAGLTSDSIAALEGRYAELASKGYDLSAMFEETSNGIHLNKRAVSELEQAYASSKLSETDSQLEILKTRYGELTDEIKNCSDAGKRAELYSDQQEVAQKINDLATLAAQYEGLASAYNAWQNMESAGSERDMYESIISGFETVGDEISRGWYDDGTIKFLELITGQTDLAGKSASELKEIWNSLDDTIKGTSYSVRDFFTTNEDGDSTNTGAYNFLKAIEQLGKNGKLKFENGKTLNDLITRKDGKEDGTIVSFDFDVVGGDKAIADALGISEEMVQIIQRALDDAGFVVTLDGKYTLLSDLKTSAEEANNSLKKLQTEGLKNLKDLDLNFDFNVDTVEGYQEQLEKALNVLDKFRNKDGTLQTDKNGNLVNGAKEALEIAEYYTAAMDKLTEPKFMQIDTSTVDKELQEPIEKIQEIGDLCKEKHLVSLTGDTEDLKEVQDEIDKVAKEIEELDPEIKAQIGIEDDWTAEEIADKIEKGEIEIPAELKLDVQMSEDIKDMRLLMMKQLGLVDDNEVKLKVSYDIDDSVVDKLTPEKQKIAVEFIAENEEWFNSLTKDKKEIVINLVANGFDIDGLSEEEKEVAVKYVEKGKKLSELTKEEQEVIVKLIGDDSDIKDLSFEEKEALVKYIVDGGNVDKWKPEEKKAFAKYLVDGGDVDGWSPEAKNAFVKYLVDGGDPDKFDPDDKESWVVYKKDSTEPDNYNADKNGTVTYDKDSTEPDNYNPDKKGTVTYGKDSSIPDKYNPDKNGTVKFKKDSSAIDKWKPVVTGLAKFTLSMIIPQSIRTALSKIGISIADGTANVDGTANGSAFSDGTATKLRLAGKSGKALKQGDWGVKKTETALTGELGPELVVYGNRYWTVGDTGAEFSHIPKGAIVFNHRQTEEIFKYGKVTSGGGRGRIYANGTALAQGTAFSKGSGGGEEAEVKSVVVGTNKVTGEKYTKDTDDAKDEFEDTIDWIKTVIDRVERAISQLDTKTSSVYRSWSERNSNLVSEIDKVREEISLQEQAYDKYMAAANAVELSSSYVNKVKNGAIDIDTITDETLKEKIDDFQKYYEAALDCQDAILELQEKEKALYQQRFDNVVTQYEGMLSIIEHEKNMLDEYIAQSEAQAWLISENYYKALISNEQSTISKLEQEKSALLSELNTALSSGNIAKGSEAYYDMVNQIDEVTLAIEESNTAILEYQQSIQQLKFEQFDLLQEKITAITEEADFLVKLLSNDKLFDDNGKLTDEGSATMGLHGVNYNTYMHQADLAREEAERIKKELASDKYDTELEARYREMIALQQEYILNAEQEKQAIRDLVEEGYDAELDALEELIDKKNEALESERDLYEYQKKVKEQTEEISALEKQLSAFENDDSEEAKAKVQQIKVDLEAARQDLEETETDRLIESTATLLDNLYLEYEEILNMRLDNIDALIQGVIDQINADATSISETLNQTATDVGYNLSESMDAIWATNTGSINSIITAYGDKFDSAATTTNAVLKNIKSDLATMISQLNSIANTNAKSAASSSAANSSQANTSSSKNNTSSTTNKTDTSSSSSSGEIKVGGKINAGSAPIYDYAGDTSGERQLYRNDPIYTVLSEKNGYVLTRWHKLSSGYTGWFKKSDVKAYATGAKKIGSDDIAWTQEKGEEFIVRPSDGAILTPVAKGDSVLNAQASRNIWNMANSPTEFIKNNLSVDSGNIPNNSGSHNSISQNFENITFSLPNVRNYNELLSDLQKDPKFDKLVKAMTIDQVAGRSKLAKGKVIR